MIYRVIISSAVFLLFISCFKSSDQGSQRSENCGSDDIIKIKNMEMFKPEDIAIYLDTQEDQNIQIIKADLLKYLKQLWGTENLEIIIGKPNFSKKMNIWFTTSQEGKNHSGENIKDGFVIKKVDTNLILIYAPDNINLSYGIYNFLEELGIRFFHPFQEFIPKFKGIFLPKMINIVRASPYKIRGIHLHLLHPIEYLRSFNEAGEQNLSEAKMFIDWIQKTGQNYIQWSILKTLDFSTWIEHAKKILDYAHMRGIKVGAVVLLWSGSSLQNAYVLVESPNNWEKQLESNIDFIMQLPWDHIEIGFGEFFGTSPQFLIDMLNYIANHISNKYPGKTVSVINHVGNYPELWTNYNGETVFFYHLPKFADQRIINNVHTVFFFDLFRDWGMYNHPNFHLQRDYIFELLPSRVVRYKPESAYWATADIDVPAFLPEYIYSRWIDINGLVREIKNRGLPMIEGHVLFSSGHEWGYWLTDYLTAKMLWEPEKEFDHFIKHYAQIYGDCSEGIQKALSEFINLQTIYLFDNRLISYISGEDIYDDLGYLMGIITHPKRVQFEEFFGFKEEEIQFFEKNTLEKLSEMAEEIYPIELTVNNYCDNSDDLLKPWCLEILDGIKIIRLRLLHSLNLYRAVLSSIRAQDHEKYLSEASSLREQAKGVIENRAKYYRVDVERVATSYSNHTIYPFGYLKQAHTLCLWERQHKQAEYVIQNKTKPPLSQLPSCIN